MKDKGKVDWNTARKWFKKFHIPKYGSCDRKPTGYWRNFMLGYYGSKLSWSNWYENQSVSRQQAVYYRAQFELQFDFLPVKLLMEGKRVTDINNIMKKNKRLGCQWLKIIDDDDGRGRGVIMTQDVNNLEQVLCFFGGEVVYKQPKEIDMYMFSFYDNEADAWCWVLPTDETMEYAEMINDGVLTERNTPPQDANVYACFVTDSF